MKIVKIIGIVSLLWLTLTACGPEPAAEPNLEEARSIAAEAPVVDTATHFPTAPAPATATIEPPTSTPTIAPTATTKPTFTPMPTAEAVADLGNCIVCHSDQNLLINTASPEEEKEPSESSGVG